METSQRFRKANLLEVRCVQVAIEQAVEIQRRLAEQVAEENATDAVEAVPDRPCTIYALGAGCSGGFLGGLYGFGTDDRALIELMWLLPRYASVVLMLTAAQAANW